MYLRNSFEQHVTIQYECILEIHLNNMNQSIKDQSTPTRSLPPIIAMPAPLFNALRQFFTLILELTVFDTTLKLDINLIRN
jgi:hypothetical protein